MEKQQKKRIKKYISWMLIAVIVTVLACLPMFVAGEEPETGPQASILSAEAEYRDISTAVLGGGVITAQSPEELTIPAAVKLTEYLVHNGDVVVEGQPIASVDRVSVMTAITQVQETMNDLQEQLNDVGSETDSNAVTATAGGTVKSIFAAEGDSVRDVMLRDGALAVLSLDGLMAVQIERHTGLSGGDTVCVTLPDGIEVTGTVESNLEGILTVTIDDGGYSAGAEVNVNSKDGKRIGTGTLYIHSPWNVVAYSGTVSRVRVKEGAMVSSGQRLFDLDVAGHTARFDSLARQHREYEELMLKLFKMYQSESIVAPCDGMISGVDENGTYMLSDRETGLKVMLLANGPAGDENEYTNYVGQVTEVGIDGLIMKMNPQAISLTDYHDLSGVPLDTKLMTQSTVYTGNAPIYVLTEVTAGDEADSVPTTESTAPSDPTAPTDSHEPTMPETGMQTSKEWVQISPYSITAGDILLFAGGIDGVVWVVKVSHTELSKPQSPTPTRPHGGNSGMGGTTRIPGRNGNLNPEESNDLYSLDTLTVASVTAQEQVSVPITIDELDISRISVGQPVQISIAALGGESFIGTVTEISNSGTNEGGNSKYSVTVSMDKESTMLPGMTAHVSISLSSARNSLCLPVAALVETGTETIVYTGYDEESKELVGPVKVTTGTSDGEYVQILSGISDGQTVYYSYYDTLVISNAPEMSGGFRFG